MVQVQKVQTSRPRVQYNYEHMLMCNRNGIKIYYNAINNYNGNIVIDDNGKLRFGKEIYKNQGQKFTKSDKLWWKVVESLYTQEYFKLPDNLRIRKPVEIDFSILVQFIKTLEK